MHSSAESERDRHTETERMCEMLYVCISLVINSAFECLGWENLHGCISLIISLNVCVSLVRSSIGVSGM